MDSEALNRKTTLSLHEAAQLLSAAGGALDATEARLAQAVDQGELPASITRWASEQWDGARLEGNIDRIRTLITRADLDAWQAGQNSA
jgi:hypothetical protein